MRCTIYIVLVPSSSLCTIVFEILVLIRTEYFYLCEWWKVIYGLVVMFVNGPLYLFLKLTVHNVKNKHLNTKIKGEFLNVNFTLVRLTLSS